MKALSLKGTRDIGCGEEELRDWVLQSILAVYRKNGFARIATPIIEDAENISKSDGGDNLNLVFRVLKRGEKFSEALEAIKVGRVDTLGAVDALSDIALRYDLTLPLVRFYAAHKESLPKPFKVIQADKVYRAERPQKGRLREFMQCDIDIIGDDSINAEIELIDVTARALEAVGFEGFCVNINDRRLLRSMLVRSGFPQEALDSVCITIDKLDKVGREGVASELLEKGFSKNAIDTFMQSLDTLMRTFENGGQGSGELSNTLIRSDDGRDLATVLESARALGAGRYEVRFNPSLVRGQGYYTGLVFEITAGTGQAIAGGGRYDHMVEKFTGAATSAAGFSIGFERICAILAEKGFAPPNAKKKCALLFDGQKDADFVAVLKAAKELQATFDVGVFKKAKNAKAQYAALEANGYARFAFMQGERAVIKNNEAGSGNV